MSDMFNEATLFNMDISTKSNPNSNSNSNYWDTSNVTNMSNMFNGASNFDFDLGGNATVPVPLYVQVYRCRAPLMAWSCADRDPDR